MSSAEDRAAFKTAEFLRQTRAIRVVRLSQQGIGVGRITAAGTGPDGRANSGRKEVGMNAVLRRRLEMAVRVRDFLRAHKTDGVGDGTAVTRLEELVRRAEALVAQQQAGRVATRSSTVRRGEVRRALQTKLLKYLAAVGVVAAKGNTELAVQFEPASANTSNLAFLTGARAMLEKATAQKDLLIGQGMSEQLLDDLAAALTEFENTEEASRAGRRDHVGASADLPAVTLEILDQVRLLDGLVRYRFGDNPELMGVWASARNVLGPFRSRHGSEQGVGETPAEAGPSEIAPAA